MTDNPLPGGEAPTPQALRALLQEKGVTIKELAPLVRYSYCYLTSILSGRAVMPKGFPARFHEALETALNAKRRPGGGLYITTRASSRPGVKVETELDQSVIDDILAYFHGGYLPELIRWIVGDWTLEKKRNGEIPRMTTGAGAPSNKKRPAKTDNPAGR